MFNVYLAHKTGHQDSKSDSAPGGICDGNILFHTQHMNPLGHSSQIYTKNMFWNSKKIFMAL